MDDGILKLKFGKFARQEAGTPNWVGKSYLGQFFSFSATAPERLTLFFLCVYVYNNGVKVQ